MPAGNPAPARSPSRTAGIVAAGNQHTPPKGSNTYESPHQYAGMIWDRDVMVQMRDGVSLCADVYRPDDVARFPALLAIARHNKDLQNPDIAGSLPPQPAWSTMWQGAAEAGDSDYLTSRGYAHVVANPRGYGKSEDGGSAYWDAYDLIEWIAAQPWCNGNVGMIGLSAFAQSQWQAAMLQPPHLKAIFPFDPGPAFGAIHDRYPGGVLQSMLYLIDGQSVLHGVRGRPGTLTSEDEERWQAAMQNPDYRMYSWIYNILSQKGQIHGGMFAAFLDPYEKEGAYEESESGFERIKIPVYTGAGWHAYTYHLHLMGAQNYYEGIEVPKRLLFTGVAHMERPFHSIHDEILRWYDHWLKGIDTGIMDEPPVKIWVEDANQWYHGDRWPLPEAQWTKFYLHSWERLRTEPFVAGSRDGYKEPDTFVQMPPTQTRSISRLRYMTPPLPTDTLVIGPISLVFYAEIDQDDTNWIIVLKDVGPDHTVKSGRAGEFEPSGAPPERELTRGWLMASQRALDPKRTKPYRPWHRLTRAARQPVVPGEINEYRVEVLPTANLFKRSHRICVEITSLDLPSGTGFGNDTEYIPYHICSSKTVVHRVHRNGEYPSHLLLPIVPIREPA